MEYLSQFSLSFSNLIILSVEMYTLCLGSGLHYQFLSQSIPEAVDEPGVCIYGFILVSKNNFTKAVCSWRLFFEIED